MGTFALHFEGMKLLFLFAVATFSSATYAASIEGPLLSIKDLMGGMEGKRNNRVLSWADKPEITKEEQGERKKLPEDEKKLPKEEKELPEEEKELPEEEKKLPEVEEELPEEEKEQLEGFEKKEQLEGFRGLPQQPEGEGEKQLGIKGNEPEVLSRLNREQQKRLNEFIMLKLKKLMKSSKDF